MAGVGNVPAGTPLGDIFSKMIAGTARLTGYAMPVFLALPSWGVLGKFEKWALATAPRLFPPK